MLTVKVINISSVSQGLTSGFRKTINSIATDLAKELKTHTPVNTGRAQKGWQKLVNDTDFTIENKVPYVGYLEKPYVKSKKAPKGIIGPSLDNIKRKY